MSDAAPAATRQTTVIFCAIPTRWIDNDSYGHVNNVVYYAYFDTVVNEHLIRAGGLDIRGGPAIGLVVETLCRFHRPLSFPGDRRRRVARLPAGHDFGPLRDRLVRRRRRGRGGDRAFRARLGRSRQPAPDTGARRDTGRADAAAARA